MIKIFIILVVAAVIESAGVALLSGGLKSLKSPDTITAGNIIRLIGQGACNPKILLGIGLEAIFFGALLYLLSQRDVSFVWPLTSLGFIFTTLAGHFLLSEKISPTRWLGVALIAFGAALTGYSEAVKTPQAQAESSTLHPQ